MTTRGARPLALCGSGGYAGPAVARQGVACLAEAWQGSARHGRGGGASPGAAARPPVPRAGRLAGAARAGA